MPHHQSSMYTLYTTTIVLANSEIHLYGSCLFLKFIMLSLSVLYIWVEPFNMSFTSIHMSLRIITPSSILFIYKEITLFYFGHRVIIFHGMYVPHFIIQCSGVGILAAPTPWLFWLLQLWIWDTYLLSVFSVPLINAQEYWA